MPGVSDAQGHWISRALSACEFASTFRQLTRVGGDDLVILADAHDRPLVIGRTRRLARPLDDPCTRRLRSAIDVEAKTAARRRRCGSCSQTVTRDQRCGRDAATGPLHDGHALRRAVCVDGGRIGPELAETISVFAMSACAAFAAGGCEPSRTAAPSDRRNIPKSHVYPRYCCPRSNYPNGYRRAQLFYIRKKLFNRRPFFGAPGNAPAL